MARHEAQGLERILVTSRTRGADPDRHRLALTFSKAYNQTVMLRSCNLQRRGSALRAQQQHLINDKPLKEYIWPQRKVDP